jgi:hypothetical protein
MERFLSTYAGILRGSFNPMRVTPIIVVAPAEFEFKYWRIIPFLVIISIGRLSQTISFGLMVTFSYVGLGPVKLRPANGIEAVPVPFPLVPELGSLMSTSVT